MMSYKYSLKLLKKADELILAGNIEAAKDIFKEVFEKDTNYMHAVILTEANPEYSIFSKEFNKLLNKYYIMKNYEEAFTKMKEHLDVMLENDDTIEVNSTDELIEKVEKYMLEHDN